jgi:predicted transcriptional regulator
MNDQNSFKEKIQRILSKHPEGLSLSEISRLVGAHRHTITKYVHELIGAGIVFQRDLGTVKLHYLTGTSIKPEKLVFEELKRKLRK